MGNNKRRKRRKIDLYNAQHPARQKAIQILENIAEYMGDEDIFDCKDGDTKWYDLEDSITEIIVGKK